jgi:hypothetical protein
MLKIFIGFVVFAALAMFVIMKGGDSLDMGGEKHGADAVHAPAEAASGAASAASADASAAK